MNNRTNTTSTNLYNLISAMHDEHGSIDSSIPKKIERMAASGKIKWETPEVVIRHKKCGLKPAEVEIKKAAWAT